ncbi:hypothetical protein [Almyronema epifaneia]|uniref:DUF3148 domain-containing protein n=1 Tax=Almyronema epifaneia S1 TaxID=2991925 RepID=A0ABW6IK09_9CYAN
MSKRKAKFQGNQLKLPLFKPQIGDLVQDVPPPRYPFPPAEGRLIKIAPADWYPQGGDQYHLRTESGFIWVAKEVIKIG